jgi:hypothetical protein
MKRTRIGTIAIEHELGVVDRHEYERSSGFRIPDPSESRRARPPLRDPGDPHLVVLVAHVAELDLCVAISSPVLCELRNDATNAVNSVVFPARPAAPAADPRPILASIGKFSPASSSKARAHGHSEKGSGVGFMFRDAISDRFVSAVCPWSELRSGFGESASRRVSSTSHGCTSHVARRTRQRAPSTPHVARRARCPQHVARSTFVSVCTFSSRSG